MSFQSFRQLEIRWIDLEPTRGAETQKKRPCVIIQADIVNQGSKTIVIAPILPGHKNWPFVVNVFPSKSNGLDKERHINLKQMRAVDVSRIQNLQGILEQQYLKQLLEAIKLIFAL
jgi:mRNA interferase MazF